ncbi:hypothetical protein HYPSUDRAFT_39295 [Hypholoma sublateritium FD-334 SS-4]|uniref:Uncharacterized protein n=1 Tax=Hypholoma sublateritium (strain FD-334 SS-4) TaxID=945553 RepID=A0A0D2NYL5_HYPSF|nr:hypothetical protein HYPSUDRAFT_39295 [Hypholoma sublateritium FD-334 SS-4]
MDSSSSFSGTITGGIQDISALLPLLGTEQCERHVGSALDRGFLYSSVTPISIFGSLGIVRAAFNILIASLNIQQYRFLGAKKLNDGGFNASGVVAPMIALDPHHPKRFLAESRLETMLTDEHIENVEDLTVSWGKGIAWWNFLLVVFTLVIATAGLLPYILIIHDSQHTTIRLLFPIGFGFPILRVVGSALCVNVAQFLIQIRILVLLKTRLLFITINRVAKEAGIDLEFEINSKVQRKKGKERRSMWNSELASEKCIWALEKWLAAESQSIADPEKDINIPAAIYEIYKSQYKRQLESLHKTIPLWINPVLCVGLVAGILLTVAGYVGCFYLIQHSSNNSIGPLLWLILEALLSIIRILVWAINPSWDDSRGIVFELQLASHAPLITCNKFESDITDDGVAPVTRANSFLEEVVAYTGPLPLFNVNNVALYYILTAKGKSPPQSANTLPHGKLYVVIFDHKEQTSRVLCKQDDQSTFSIYISALEPVLGSTAINVRVKLSEEGITAPKTHFLTADAGFMDELTAHYDEIISQLQKQKSNLERKAFFGKTWAMQRPVEEEGDSEDDVTQSSAYGSEENWDLLTNEDAAYLRQGQVERRWREMHSHLEEWIELYITLYTKELLQDVPVDLVFKKNESVSIVQKHEANEVEYLLIECRTCLEQLLLSTVGKWNEFVEMDHNDMVDTVIQGTFSDAASLQELSESGKQHGEEIRKSKLESRLADERDDLLEKQIRSHRENMHSRLVAQAESTEQRILGRRYNDPTGETIVQTWRSLEDKIYLGSSSQDDETAIDELNRTEENTIVTRRNAFRADMQTRFSEGNEDIRNFTDEIDRKNEYDKFELMKARCFQRIDQLFSRMQDQMAEFEELHTNDILTADSHELVEYWRTGSLQERRRLLDRTQKYLELSDASIQAVGGRQNMARALMRSQDFAFIDVSQTTLFTAEEVMSIVKGVKSVTGVASCLGDEADKEIFKAVRTNINSAVAAKQDICFYGNAVVADYYRKGYPYLLFRDNGASTCIVLFYIREKRDHILTLRHCVTTSNGNVDITLNKHPLESTWGQSQAVKLNFANEDIHLPEAYLMDVGQSNVLTIVLADDSEGVYWLSDVFLPVQPVLSRSIVVPTS